MMAESIRKKTTLASILFLAAILFSACGNDVEEIPESPLNQNGTQEEKERYKEFTSTSGDLSILATELWQEDKTLHKESDLSLYNEAYQSYLITLTDDKAAFSDDMDMDHYSELIAASAMKDLKEATVTEREAVASNGLEGSKFHVSGNIDDVSVTYVFLVLENEKEFVQVILWSFTENIENNASYYERIIESVKYHEVENDESGN